MPDGFPMYAPQDHSDIITIRMPRFSGAALYDPTIDAGSQMTDHNSDQPGAAPPSADPFSRPLLLLWATGGLLLVLMKP